MKTPVRQTTDELLAQGVCAVFLKNSMATGWLFSDEGHVLTVGHLFVGANKTDLIEVQFLDDRRRTVRSVFVVNSTETAVEFAVLQLEDPGAVSGRTPIPVALVESPPDGAWKALGYGKTFIEQSTGRGTFLGKSHVQNSSEDFFFELDSKQTGEHGFSGSPIFSEDLQAVVAIQTEATTAQVGAQRDTILAVPLFRIAERWKNFSILAFQRGARRDEEEKYASPKKYLEYRIKKAYKTLSEGGAEPTEESSASEILETKYAYAIKLYLRIYSLLCHRIGQPPSHGIVKIKKNFPELDAQGDAYALQSAAGPKVYTNLPGRRVTIGVSQMFRIADLLTRPENVRSREFYEAITKAAKMRRSLKERKSFKLGNLGSLRPVTQKPNAYDSFWNPAIPDFSSPAVQPLCFIPYELSLVRQLLNVHLGSSDDSALSNLTISQTIQNAQTNGRLRIYPPGIGVISLSLALEFKEAVPIELVAQIAHNIEQLLFVGSGDEKPYDFLMLRIINRVIDHLFIETGVDEHRRRWTPPVTTFSFPDADGLVPADRLEELAYLMSLAPANLQSSPYLETLIRQALRTPRWKQEGILAVSSQGVALFFVDEQGNKMLKRRRNNFRLWLNETHELISAAAFAQQAFAEEIEGLFDGKALDDSYLPQNGRLFIYLKSLLETMQQVMRAINSIGGANGHLRNQGAGALLTFAKDVWAYSNPVDRSRLEMGLAYISEWLNANVGNSPAEIVKLSAVVNSIRGMSPPFASFERPQNPSSHPQNQEFETDILEMFSELEEMTKKYEPKEFAESRYQLVIQDLRKQLGL